LQVLTTGGSPSYASLSDGTGNLLIGSNGSGLGIAGTFTNHNFSLWSNSTERVIVKSDGEIQIAGTTDQGPYNLQVNGTGVWGAGAYVNGSDMAVKYNVEPISTSLDVVMSLKPVTYKYKESFSKNNETQVGFIAQDLILSLKNEKYLNGVVYDNGGTLGVSYSSIIPILTKAIQELKAESDSLRSDVTQLKTKNNAIKIPKIIDVEKYSITDYDRFLLIKYSNDVNLTLPDFGSNPGMEILITNISSNFVKTDQYVFDVFNNEFTNVLLSNVSGSYILLVSDGEKWLITNKY
jgi:hypothetical protein